MRTLVVCLTMVTTAPIAAATEAADARLNGLSLLRSGGRVSVAVDMTTEPEKIVMRNVAPTILEVEVGPIGGRVDSQLLTPSLDVPFIAQLSLKEFTAGQRRSFIRMRMTLRSPSRTNVRVVGGTVYVDFAEIPVKLQRLPGRPPVPVTVAAAAPPAAAGQDGNYRQSIDASIARLNEVGPFLMSAASAPSPDVLNAVAQTLMTVHDSLRAVRVPAEAEAAPAHSMLTSAVALAIRAVASDFNGDRVAQARRALALVDDARALLP